MSKKRYDTGRGSGVTENPFVWRLRMKLPPVRKQKKLEREEFEKLLKVQQAIKTPTMSKDEFIKCLSEPEIYGRRRKYRTLKEKRQQAMEWFSKQEENWWSNEQLKILAYLDRKNFQFEVKTYKMWSRDFIKRCKRIYNRLKKQDSKLAKEFIEEAWKRLEAAKPRKRGEVEQRIVNRIRRLTIQRRYYELHQLYEELRPLLPPEVANGLAS